MKYRAVLETAKKMSIQRTSCMELQEIDTSHTGTVKVKTAQFQFSDLV